MSPKNIEILREIRNVFSFYVAEQEKNPPTFKKDELAYELMGNLADLSHFQSSEDSVLIAIVNAYVTASKNDSPSQAMEAMIKMRDTCDILLNQ